MLQTDFILNGDVIKAPLWITSLTKRGALEPAGVPVVLQGGLSVQVHLSISFFTDYFYFMFPGSLCVL